MEESMKKVSVANVAQDLFVLLSRLESADERQRAIGAALLMMGDEQKSLMHSSYSKLESSTNTDFSGDKRVKIWMEQKRLTQDDLNLIFDTENGVATVIAEIPGRNNKEKTLNAYILTGMANFLLKGDQSFDDSSARALCNNHGCYDMKNHAANIKALRSLAVGSKDTGWKLTTPGLNRGAELINDIVANAK